MASVVTPMDIPRAQLNKRGVWDRLHGGDVYGEQNACLDLSGPSDVSLLIMGPDDDDESWRSVAPSCCRESSAMGR
jgi:hypothetical protein